MLPRNCRNPPRGAAFPVWTRRKQRRMNLPKIGYDSESHRIRVKTLLMSMKKAKEGTTRRGRTEICGYYGRRFSDECDSIIGEAELACPEPPAPPGKRGGRRKKGKFRALGERLRGLKASVCLFIHDFLVPFDKNLAERGVRNVKTRTRCRAASAQRTAPRTIWTSCGI